MVKFVLLVEATAIPPRHRTCVDPDRYAQVGD